MVIILLLLFKCLINSDHYRHCNYSTDLHIHDRLHCLNIQERDRLEDQLSHSLGDLEESKQYIQQLHSQQMDDKKDRAR